VRVGFVCSYCAADTTIIRIGNSDIGSVLGRCIVSGMRYRMGMDRRVSDGLMGMMSSTE